LRRFADAVGVEVALRELSYQVLFDALERIAGVDQGYLSYLRGRYGASSIA
jgi:hypothetical protein